MSYKWIGAILIITGCGGFGFSLAAGHRKIEQNLKQMIRVLQFMESELQYKLTPLPELCRLAGMESVGALREILLNLAEELNLQTAPDVCSCMRTALKKSRDISVRLRRLLIRLGHVLGRFDLPGQLRGLEAVRSECEEQLAMCRKDRDIRIRSYETLGLCAGAALAILFV